MGLPHPASISLCPTTTATLPSPFGNNHGYSYLLSLFHYNLIYSFTLSPTKPPTPFPSSFHIKSDNHQSGIGTHHGWWVVTVTRWRGWRRGRMRRQRIGRFARTTTTIPQLRATHMLPTTPWWHCHPASSNTTVSTATTLLLSPSASSSWPPLLWPLPLP